MELSEVTSPADSLGLPGEPHLRHLSSYLSQQQQETTHMPCRGSYLSKSVAGGSRDPRYRHRSVSWAGEGLACRVAISPLDSESLVSDQARAPKKGRDVYTIQGRVFIFIFLKLGYARSLLWHVGSSSLTRNQTWAPCIGSAES